MSIWAKLFRRAPPAQSSRISSVDRGSGARKLLSDETSKQAVRDSLQRLEAAGLRIRSALDRDLIVVRCLRNFSDSYQIDDLAAFDRVDSGLVRESFDLRTFFAAGQETDCFYGCDKADFAFLPTMSDAAWDDFADDHSRSVFENAAEICIVNEHDPEDYIRERVEELNLVSCGDFEVRSIEVLEKAGMLSGSVTLNSGESGRFEFKAEKRPDLTSFYKAMNLLMEPAGKGRFLALLTGSSEGHIIVYINKSEQSTFREWESRQYCGIGPAPVDWL